MLRYFGLATLALNLYSALLPEAFGPYRRTSASPAALENEPIWKEYGLQTAERAEYAASGDKLVIIAWRLADPTGAFAAWQWQQAAGSVSQYENYVFRVESGALKGAERTEFESRLTGVNRTSLPPLPGYFPKKGLIPLSARYLLGPLSLGQFEPRIPAEIAAFERGAEGQVARYQLGSGEATLLIFSYPTPQMAADRAKAFGQIPGTTVQRSGPLVAGLLGVTDPDQAKTFLQQIRYQPNITWSEETPKDPGNAGEMLQAIVTLAGILILASVLLGFVFGGIKRMLAHFGIRIADDRLTSLDLSGK